MRTLPLVLAAALAVAVPVAGAKEDNAAIVVGPSGTALVEPYSTVRAVLERVRPAESPPGPFALVYVQRRLLPQAPGRWYPAAATYCDARGRCVHAAQLTGSFGSGRITGLYRGAPTRLASLARDGGPLSVRSTLAYAIELAFGQAGSSTRAAPPQECTQLHAAWQGAKASSRPTAFCVGMNGGVYAGGRLYPLYSGIAEKLIR